MKTRSATKCNDENKPVHICTPRPNKKMKPNFNTDENISRRNSQPLKANTTAQSFIGKSNSDSSNSPRILKEISNFKERNIPKRQTRSAKATTITTIISCMSNSETDTKKAVHKNGIKKEEKISKSKIDTKNTVLRNGTKHTNEKNMKNKLDTKKSVNRNETKKAKKKNLESDINETNNETGIAKCSTGTKPNICVQPNVAKKPIYFLENKRRSRYGLHSRCSLRQSIAKNKDVYNISIDDEELGKAKSTKRRKPRHPKPKATKTKNTLKLKLLTTDPAFESIMPQFSVSSFYKKKKLIEKKVLNSVAANKPSGSIGLLHDGDSNVDQFDDGYDGSIESDCTTSSNAAYITMTSVHSLPELPTPGMSSMVKKFKGATSTPRDLDNTNYLTKQMLTGAEIDASSVMNDSVSNLNIMNNLNVPPLPTPTLSKMVGKFVCSSSTPNLNSNDAINPTNNTTVPTVEEDMNQCFGFDQDNLTESISANFLSPVHKDQQFTKLNKWIGANIPIIDQQPTRFTTVGVRHNSYNSSVVQKKTMVLH